MTDDFKYQEDEILKVLSELENTFRSITLIKEAGYHDEDSQAAYYHELEMLEGFFRYNAERIYLLCIAYFEGKKSFNLLKKFKKSIKNINEQGVLTPYHVYGEPTNESWLVSELKTYMSVFILIDSYSLYIYNPELVYLEKILKKTGHILHMLNKKPKNEAGVYNSVKFIIDLIFGTSKRSPFNTEAKCFKPDILIPSLKCAIEYKYAEDEKRLKDTIGQILEDVDGYFRHRDYQYFYAVFYITSNFMTEDIFIKYWNDRKFPANWKPILVIGT